MAQPKESNSENPGTEAYAQHILSDWADAIMDFNQWNAKLDHVIGTCNPDSENYVASSHEKITLKEMADLMQLRDEVTENLALLLGDMSEAENESEDEGDAPLELEQLKAHTSTIRQYNERMRDALTVSSRGPENTLQVNKATTDSQML